MSGVHVAAGLSEFACSSFYQLNNSISDKPVVHDWMCACKTWCRGVMSVFPHRVKFVRLSLTLTDPPSTYSTRWLWIQFIASIGICLAFHVHLNCENALTKKQTACEWLLHVYMLTGVSRYLPTRPLAGSMWKWPSVSVFGASNTKYGLHRLRAVIYFIMLH